MNKQAELLFDAPAPSGTIQQYRDADFGSVVFVDRRENLHSEKCHPRDIRIIEGESNADVREEIAVDIRLSEGAEIIGVRKHLKFK